MGQVVDLFNLDGMLREIEELERSKPRSAAIGRAVDRLTAAIEELQTAGEELEVKNEELQRALLELDRERKRYQQLFHAMPDGYLVSNREGVVIEANARAEELLGVEVGSVAGASVSNVFEALGSDAVRRLETASQEAVMAELGSGLLEIRAVPAQALEGGTSWLIRDLGRPEVEGEDLSTDDADVARSWLNVYAGLIAVNEQALDALQAVGGVQSSPRRRVEADRRTTEARLERLRHRLRVWRDRHAELAGMRFDRRTRRLEVGLRHVRLTHREAQLLAFLLEHPGVAFGAEALLNRAWLASFLSQEQLRTYVGRLRGKLESVDAPCRIENVRGDGYRLAFADS